MAKTLTDDNIARLAAELETFLARYASPDLDGSGREFKNGYYAGLASALDDYRVADLLPVARQGLRADILLHALQDIVVFSTDQSVVTRARQAILDFNHLPDVFVALDQSHSL